MRELARQIELLAASDRSTVLLAGESGTGKGWAARVVHHLSPRASGPFVEVNCGLSATFLDSELFGHEKGAYTDAKERKQGLFELADGGTIFLDEIGELAPELQPKLLKVLDSKTFRRLGGTREMTVNVRLITATNRDLVGDGHRGRAPAGGPAQGRGRGRPTSHRADAGRGGAPANRARPEVSRGQPHSRGAGARHFAGDADQ